MKISLVFITHYTPLQPTTHTYKPLSWKKLRELVSMYYEVNRTAILCRSTGREVSATNSPRRLEAPKLHNLIIIRLNLLLDSMEN